MQDLVRLPVWLLMSQGWSLAGSHVGLIGFWASSPWAGIPLALAAASFLLFLRAVSFMYYLNLVQWEVEVQTKWSLRCLWSADYPGHIVLAIGCDLWKQHKFWANYWTGTFMVHFFSFSTNNFEHYFKGICHLNILILQRIKCINSSYN